MDEKNPEISPVPEPTPASTSAPEPSPVSGPVPEPMTAAPAADASAAAPAAPVSAGPAVAEPVPDLTAAAPAADASESAPAAAAAANPFATYHAPAPVAVTPEPTAPVAPVPVPPSAQPYAVGASEPAQPYATAAAPAAPAAPTVAPYGQPAATYDAPASFYAAPDPAVYSAYGTYGAPQQPGAGAPPTPPVPPAPVYGYEPPTSGGQKRRWPWFLLGLAVGLVVGMGGCASCVGVMALADYDNYDTYDYDYNYDDEYGYDHGYDSDVPGIDSDALNESPFDTYSYDELAEMFEGAGLAAGVPGEDGRCAMGFYTVGPDGDIPAGLYFTEGSNEKLSRFYVFESESKKRGYELEDGVQYFGNYFVELDDGDLIVFLPGAAELTMHPAPATSFNPTAPYNNGCYRVGVDIPAGSYTITALPADEGETDDESAAYVMKDLEFNDDSIIDTQYVIPGGKQVVTVADGQYLELFAATATPVAQG